MGDQQQLISLRCWGSALWRNPHSWGGVLGPVTLPGMGAAPVGLSACGTSPGSGWDAARGTVLPHSSLWLCRSPSMLPFKQ